MALTPTIVKGDWVNLNRVIRKLASSILGQQASPLFTGLTLSGLTASRLIQTDANKALASVGDLTSWIAGTTNQIAVADDGDGTITLATPQDIHAGASPTFVGLTLSGLTLGSILFAGTSGVISQDNSNLFWDDSNNRLGINNNSPSVALDVTGAITASTIITGEQITSTDDITMQGHLLTMGDSGAATDTVLSFLGSTNSATITYDESSDEFDFGDADISTTGALGVGIAASPITNIIKASKSMFYEGPIIGIFGGITNTVNTNSGQSVIGLAFTAISASTTVVEDITVSEIIGVVITAKLQGPTNTPIGHDIVATDVTGYKSRIQGSRQSSGDVTITNARNFWATNPSLSNGAAVITAYAFYDEGMAAGGTNWGVYGLSAQNYLSGLLAFGQIDKAERIGSDADGTLDLYAGTSIDLHADTKLDNAKFLIIDKASGNGIKVDTATPTFGFADLLGDQFSKNTGASKPTLVAYNGAIDGWQFGNGDEAFMSYHIPHDYVLGTDIFLHIHWSQNATGATGGTIDFKYFAIYSKGHNQVSGSTFTSTPITATFSSIDINDGGSGLNQYQQHFTEVIISGASATVALFDRDDFEPDGVIELAFEMTTTNLTGTPSLPFIHYVDIHYQTTGLIGTKAKAPDFYT